MFAIWGLVDPSGETKIFDSNYSAPQAKLPLHDNWPPLEIVFALSYLAVQSSLSDIVRAKTDQGPNAS